MGQIISLGECLFTLVAFVVVAAGVWRAWAPEIMSSIRRSVYGADLLVPGTGTTLVPADEGLPLPNAVPVSRHDSELDIIVYLASIQRDKKFRFSANQIYTLVKGHRADVTGLVSEIQTGARPEYVSDLIQRVESEVMHDGK